MPTPAQRRLARLAEAAARKSDDPTRHKCFVSYHHEDQSEAETFIESFGHVFIPRVLGVSDEDDFIDSDDTDYVMDQIREKYLTDSTVTIVLVGRCTWARKYVDWEVYSTLRDSRNDNRSGLLAIELPSVADRSPRLRDRVDDNVDGDQGYARWRTYPSSAASLRTWIETAFADRDKADRIAPARPRMPANRPCT